MSVSPEFINNVKEFMEKKEFSINALARGTGLATATISLFLKGEYNGNTANVEQALQSLIDRENEKSESNRIKSKFVRTTIVKRIFEIARMCHIEGDFGVITGDAGCGKTWAAKAYVEKYKDSILIEADVGYTPRVVATKLYCALSNGDRGTIDEMRDSIIERLKGSGRLIIVDEAENLPYLSLELLRRICDKSDVGLLLIGMPRLIGNLRGKRGQYAQLYSRIGYSLKLNLINEDDCKAIVSTMLPKAGAFWDNFYNWSSKNTRRLSKLIRAASRIADVNKTDISTEVIKKAAEVLVS